MSAETKVPVFGHVQDQATYDANVAAGRTLCEECSGGGNHFFAMYRQCPECAGRGHTDPIELSGPITVSRQPDLIESFVPAAWPECAGNEDGEIWTLRSAAPTREEAERLADDYLPDESFSLSYVKTVPVVFLPDAEGPGDWRIREAHPDEHDQVAVYLKWESVETAYDAIVEPPASGGESA